MTFKCSGRHYSMQQRHAQLRNHFCPHLMPFVCGYIAEYRKYSGRKKQRRSVEKDETREINSATIQVNYNI